MAFQVIENEKDIVSLHHKLLCDRSRYIRGQVEHRRRVIIECRENDRVAHAALCKELLIDALYLFFRLADRHIDTYHILSLLVCDGI